MPNDKEIKNIVDTSQAQLCDPTSEQEKIFIPELMTVTPSPHIRAKDTTRSIMIDVCIALLPALVWGIFVFGFRVLTITVISVICAIASEFVYEKLIKKPVTVLDFSAVVTGLILALNLPVSVPFWIPAVGSVFAIIIVKQLFGGLGKNFVNPAAAARVFLFLAWSSHLAIYPSPTDKLSPIIPNVDAVASATPLSYLKQGVTPNGTTVFNTFLGYESGCIGEVSAFLLTAGFVYLLVRKIITWHIPVAYIGTVFVLSLVFAGSLPPLEFALYEIFSGAVFLGAIFMATDYVTSPITSRGRIIYGIGCGAITVFIRFLGVYPEGVSFAILIMNLLVWYLDSYTKPIQFGGAKVGKKAK